MLKNRVDEVCTRDVVRVEPATTIGDAVCAMRDHNVSSIVVVQDDRPLGIFTERNVVRLAASRGVAFSEFPISEVMSAPVLTVQRDSYIYDVFSLLGHSKVRHLVVVREDGALDGMISQTNLVDHLGDECFVNNETVADVMSRIVFTVPPETTMLRALMEMSDKSISCLVVAQRGHPLGLVSERDVATLVRDGKDISALTVADVMSTPPLCVRQDDPAGSVIPLMRERKLRRLVVTDAQGDIVGLTTQTNIVKALESRYVETLREMIREKDAALRTTSSDLEEKSLYLDNILQSLEHVGVIATDVDCRVRYFNPAAEQLLDVKAEEVVGMDVHHVVGDYFTDPVRFEKSVRLTREHGSLAFSLFLGTNGDRRFMRGRVTAIRDLDAVARGYLLTLSDITERKKAEDAVRHMAFYDPLTQLPNRLLFHDRLGLEMARGRRSGACMGLLCMDLNGFKEINDTLGHLAGDEALQQVAGRVAGTVRRHDTAARVGGDEFLFILPEVGSREHALALAHRLMEAVEQPMNVGGREVSVTASLGLALYPEHGEDEDELMRAADRAMYAAKALSEHASMCVIAGAGAGAESIAGARDRKFDRNP